MQCVGFYIKKKHVKTRENLRNRKIRCFLDVYFDFISRVKQYLLNIYKAFNVRILYFRMYLKHVTLRSS